jgi:hypothetical protein
MADHRANRAALLQQVEHFAMQKGLNGIGILGRLKTGALIAHDSTLDGQIGELIAQDPELYTNLHIPTRDELNALDDEKSNPWTHRKELRRTIILCSIAAAVQ